VVEQGKASSPKVGKSEDEKFQADYAEFMESIIRKGNAERVPGQ